nr:ABC transporter ATP-binding protein [Roseovarius sp. M141]
MNGVSIRLQKGESVALVGESGSGKTTLARAIAGLIKPISGSVFFKSHDLGRLKPSELRRLRRFMQIVFQHPSESLNPRMSVKETLGEPLKLHYRMNKKQRRRRTLELLELVNLDERFIDRQPSELSGGQQQRVSIARALATEPELLILDEPTTGLDALNRVAILELLNKLRENSGLTYLFITHDMSLIKKVCERAVVLYSGQIVEDACCDVLLKEPAHPYSRKLVSSILVPRVGSSRPREYSRNKAKTIISNSSGCPFYCQCPSAIPECEARQQSLVTVGKEHKIACAPLAQSIKD